MKLVSIFSLFTMFAGGLPQNVFAEIDYKTQIKPIFEEYCIDCHSGGDREANLQLDYRPSLLLGGDSGIKAAVPGHPEKSYLMELIQHKEPHLEMPPKEDKLSDENIALIAQWIKEGVKIPGQMDLKVEKTTDLWSFQPVERPDLPSATSHDQAIDAFLTKVLKEKGLSFNPPATAEALIRRVFVVLTGLPPSSEDIASFRKDYAESPEGAYEAVVDHLLASPHFGERWAQHWLDVIRWAETNGSESNLYRKNAWIYRDYVVDAFNTDLPYNQFLVDQVAGDQTGAAAATGFLVSGPHVPAASVGREPSAIRQARADRVDEIVQTVGASVLGMTVSCARCHNHKFDPISIQDYYSLAAFFQGVEFGGRPPEYPDDHPVQQKTHELSTELQSVRTQLGLGVDTLWENWKGYHEIHLPTQEVRALRFRSTKPSFAIDEMEIYGPESEDTWGANLLANNKDIELKFEEKYKVPAGFPEFINDGLYGTMNFKLKGKKSDSPSFEIHFDELITLNRIKVSSNREFFFETDYLDRGHSVSTFDIDMMNEHGVWQPLANYQESTARLKGSAEMKTLSARQNELIAEITEKRPQISFIGRFSQPEPAHVYHRGSPENKREEVAPAGFELLKGDLGLSSQTSDKERRMKFAQWVTDPKHPLTARVMVNRLWYHVFGQGIVPTTADFGVAGAKPMDQDLLDYLAAEFVSPSEQGQVAWSMKGMIRRMVMSKAFRQSSAPNQAGLEKDAGAASLWRYPPRRMEAEVIRDSILSASGKLDLTLGGESYRIHNVKKTYAQWEVLKNYDEKTWRRMLYQERMRRVDDKIFTAFDFPDCGQVRARRPVSTTPLQALNLMNSPFSMEQSELIAKRALNESEGDYTEAVKRVFEVILGRLPDDAELEACLNIEREKGLTLISRSLINSNEFVFLP